MDVERLTIVLDPAEARALRDEAKAEFRRPHDHVRYILRQTLVAEGLLTPTNTSKDASERSEAAHAASHV